MSSSRVFSRFALASDKVPVGTQDFVTRYRKEVEEGSELGRRIKELEQKHQVELREAFDRGRREGEAAATRVGEQKLQQFDAQFRQLMQQLVSYRETLYTQARQQLFEFSFKLANTITTARGEAEESEVLNTIDKCLHEILDKSKLRIRVHPAAAGYVKDHIDQLANLDSINSTISVEPDSRISAGGCVIETDSGSADATLESQLDELKQSLLKLDSK